MKNTTDDKVLAIKSRIIEIRELLEAEIASWELLRNDINNSFMNEELKKIDDSLFRITEKLV